MPPKLNWVPGVVVVIGSVAAECISLVLAGLAGSELFRWFMPPASVRYLPILLAESQPQMWLLLLLSSALLPVSLIAWQPRLLRGNKTAPFRSFLLLGATTVASAGYYAIKWKSALAAVDQGPTYLFFCIGAGAFLALASVVLLLVSRRSEGFLLNLSAHLVLFFWIGTFAFPVLGAID